MTKLARMGLVNAITQKIEELRKERDQLVSSRLLAGDVEMDAVYAIGDQIEALYVRLDEVNGL